MGAPYTIGITGGSGSGKTHFLNLLASRFQEDQLCLISQDHYYKPRHMQFVDDKGVHHFDLPGAIDREKFHDDILRIKRGETLYKQEYTFNNPKAESHTITFKPAPILIVEGLFVQYFPEINKELDLRIFVDAKTHIKLSRRIVRDAEERGYELSDVLYRFQHHVMPVFEELILPLKDEADLVVPNNKHFDRALDIISWALQKWLSGNQE